MIQENGSMEYQAASPDEVALVKWTARVGMTLVSRDLHTMQLEGPDKEAPLLSYEVSTTNHCTMFLVPISFVMLVFIL